ncbi:hypothetical protein GCM10027188_16310 [Lysobacter humi (ex Lee et al. 2017)]
MLALLLAANAAYGQGTTIVQRENVRYEYAKVMRVTPVYQTLNATRMEQRCDEAGATAADGSRLSRVVGAVRGAFKRDGTAAESPARNCRMVPVERQFRRPIAFDVDYAYRGAKYRSRLAEDPGHLLRIRISVTPMP